MLSLRKNMVVPPIETEKPHPQQNHILGALSHEVQARLFPHMELVELPLNAVLYESGQDLSHVYFPTDSVISLQYAMENGATPSILVVGNEGMLGITLCLCSKATRSQSLVQSAGFAYRLPRPVVKEEFARHGEFLTLLLRYTQAVITQVAQTSVCNRHHSIDKQLCRWLLISLDRVSHNRLTMTHEFIGNMLGVRREGITEAATKLRNAGVISYKRGMIEVLDRDALEALSCECYEAVKRETESLLDYLPQRHLTGKIDCIPVAKLPAAGATRGRATRSGTIHRPRPSAGS